MKKVKLVANSAQKVLRSTTQAPSRSPSVFLVLLEITLTKKDFLNVCLVQKVTTHPSPITPLACPVNRDSTPTQLVPRNVLLVSLEHFRHNSLRFLLQLANSVLVANTQIPTTLRFVCSVQVEQVRLEVQQNVTQLLLNSRFQLLFLNKLNLNQKK
jgi:hypothetical protein